MSEATTTPSSPRLQQAMFVGLLLWAVGVQTQEGLATLGLAITVICAFVAWWPRRSWQGVSEGLHAWWPLALFCTWAVLAPLVRGHTPDGTGVGRLFDWVALPAAVVAFSSMATPQRRTLLTVTVALFVMSCIAAGLQHVGWWPSLKTLEALSWTKLPFYRVYEEIPGAPGRYMGGGLILHRLKFSHIAGLIVVGAAALGYARTGRVRRALWCVAVLGLISILIFAYARAAGAALVGTLFIMMLLARLRLSRLLAAAAVVALLAGGTVAMVPSLRTRFSLIRDSGSNGDRDQLWASGLRAVASSPLVGIGLGRFRPSKFATPQMPKHILENPGKAHNQFLSYAAETGIPGALLFILLLGWIAFGMSGRTSPAGIGLLVYFVVLSFFHDPLFQAPFSMALVLSLAVTTVLAREARSLAEAPPSR